MALTNGYEFNIIVKNLTGEDYIYHRHEEECLIKLIWILVKNKFWLKERLQ